MIFASAPCAFQIPASILRFSSCLLHSLPSAWNVFLLPTPQGCPGKLQSFRKAHLRSLFAVLSQISRLSSSSGKPCCHTHPVGLCTPGRQGRESPKLPSKLVFSPVNYLLFSYVNSPPFHILKFLILVCHVMLYMLFNLSGLPCYHIKFYYSYCNSRKCVKLFEFSKEKIKSKQRMTLRKLCIVFFCVPRLQSECKKV